MDRTLPGMPYPGLICAYPGIEGRPGISQYTNTPFFIH